MAGQSDDVDHLSAERRRRVVTPGQRAIVLRILGAGVFLLFFGVALLGIACILSLFQS